MAEMQSRDCSVDIKLNRRSKYNKLCLLLRCRYTIAASVRSVAHREVTGASLAHFDLFEVFYRCRKHTHFIDAAYVFVQTVSHALGVSHFAENSAVGRGYALYCKG